MNVRVRRKKKKRKKKNPHPWRPQHADPHCSTSQPVSWSFLCATTFTHMRTASSSLPILPRVYISFGTRSGRKKTTTLPTRLFLWRMRKRGRKLSALKNNLLVKSTLVISVISRGTLFFFFFIWEYQTLRRESWLLCSFQFVLLVWRGWIRHPTFSNYQKWIISTLFVDKNNGLKLFAIEILSDLSRIVMAPSVRHGYSEALSCPVKNILWRLKFSVNDKTPRWSLFDRIKMTFTGFRTFLVTRTRAENVDLSISWLYLYSAAHVAHVIAP